MNNKEKILLKFHHLNLNRFPKVVLSLESTIWLCAFCLILFCCNDDNSTGLNEKQPPTITSFSPLAAAAGEQVQIVGYNFRDGSVEPIVQLNGVNAPIIEASGSRITITVPAQATSGLISVSVANRAAYSASEFHVITRPIIESVTPISGVAGTLVRLRGIGFSTLAGVNSVSFNGVFAVIDSASSSEIVIRVPQGASSGKITVQVNGLMATSSIDFLVTHDIPRLGLVAYYPFNGDANDESGNGLNGQVHGAHLTSDRFGRAQQSYSFDGIDDHIRVANNAKLNISPAITLVTWAKLSSDAFSVYMLSRIGAKDGQYHGYNFITYKDFVQQHYLHGLVLSGTSTGTILSAGTAPSDQWNFLAVTQEDDHTKIYLNGQKILDQSGARSLANIDTTVGDLLIGKSAVADLENPFNGILDEVSIYNRALSEQEIQEYFLATIQR
jgi:hypothetical protein